MKKLLLQLNLCLLLLTTGTSSTIIAQTNTWQQKANYGGSARWGSFGFSIGQYGYIGGGYNGSTLNSLWMYDPTNNTWTQKSNMPFNIRTACSFVINNKAYVVGGADNFSTISGQLWEYNPINDSWTAKATYPGTPVYGAAGFAIGTKGYFGIGNAGSSTGPYKSEFYEYDPALNSWTQKASFPGSLRYATFGIAANGLGYVTGGVNENLGSYFNDFWEYNPALNTWTSKANFPGAPRNYIQGFVINGKIFVGTGQDASIQFDDFYQYDQAANTWITKANYGPGNRWLCAGFAINNDGYFGTGLVGSTNQNDFWVYTADTGIVINPVDSCITIKPNAVDGKDAILHSGLPNMNTQPHADLGAAAWTCGGLPCNNRALFEFDFSSIPTNALITDARLNLYATLNPTTAPIATSGSNNACYLQRVTSPWVENTVTWNSQPTTTNINEVILGQSTSTLQDYLNIDVTNLVQDMILSNNYGFMIKMINETYYNSMIFTSSDSPDLIRHQSITVCYTVPTGINVNAANKDDVSIYPNPFKEELFLNPMKHTSESIQLTVYDIAGRVVFILNSNGGIINLSQNTAALNSGIYFIKTKTSKTSFINKIVKL